MCRISLAGVVFLAMIQPCLAQKTLEWEFDEVVYLDVDHFGKQEVSLLGKTIETESSIRFLFKLRPTKVTKAGTTLEVTILDCQDVTKKKGEEAEKGTFKGFKDQKFRVVLAPFNRSFALRDTEHLPEAVFGNEIKDATEAEKKLYADLINTILRVHLTDALVPLPEKAVSVGDKWKGVADLKLPPLAHFIADREFSLTGQQVYQGKKLDVISWSSKTEIKPLKDEDKLLPFKVLEQKIVGKSAYDGTILWDTLVNRPVRIDSLQVYDIEILIELDGKERKAKGKTFDAFVFRFFGNNPDDN